MKNHVVKISEKMSQISPEQQFAMEQQRQQCIFCKIVRGEQEAKKVYEDDEILAILDINPASKGHLLVMPKEHYPIMPLIPVKTFENLFIKTRDLNKAISKALLAVGTNIFIANGAAAGQQSNHFMLHIIPREEMDGLNAFSLESKPVDDVKAKEAENMLKQNLSIMMNNHFNRNPKPWHKQTSNHQLVPQKITEEQVINIINQNPQLKQMMLENPEMVKKSIPSNQQLQMLFKNIDFDKLSKKFQNKLKKEKKLFKKGKVNKKLNKDVDLDAIANMFK